MSEDQEKTKPESDSKESDSILIDIAKDKKGKKPPLTMRKLVPVLAVVALVIVVAVVVILIKNSSNGGDTGQETELTYAEEIQQYSLPDNATQEHTNTKNLRIAWAYYWEESYSVSLDFLDKVVEPEENIIDSYNELYGLSLSALGRTEEAQRYTQATFEVREKGLLASSEENPEAYYYLGKLYADAGQTEKAAEYYQAFLDVYENIPVEAREYTPGYELVELAQKALEEL